MSFSPRAYQFLSRVKETLRRTPSDEKSRRGKVMREIEAWCAEYDIELADYRLDNKTLRFDQALLEKIDDMLLSLKHPPLGYDPTKLTTAQQAKYGDLEAKGAREAPRAHRVLVSLPASSAPAWLSAEHRDFQDIDWRSIELSAIDVLIQVENLDSFYSFTPALPPAFTQETGALTGGNNPLVVYRGDSQYGGGFAKLASAWANQGGLHVYAGDFDAAGVSFALSSQATHMLLPPLEWLAQRATKGHQPAKQMEYQPALREYHATLPEGHPFRGYLALILEQQRGLRQQWFDESVIAVALN